MCATGLAMLFCLSGFVFPYVYNTEPSIRSLATFLMLVSALNMPFNAYANAAYFTLRSGGRVAITFIFDSVYMWTVVMPVSLILSYCTSIPITLLFPLCQATEILKAFFGLFFLKRTHWARRLVADENIK